LLASELVQRLGGALVGEDLRVEGLGSLESAGPGVLAYAEGEPPADCRAGLLLVRQALPGRSCGVVADPKGAFIQVMDAMFHEEHPSSWGPGVSVHPTARLGQGVVLYPGVVVGARCEVGDRSVLFPHVVLYPDTIIGRDCRIHAGAVIGADGFSYHPGPQGPRKVPQVGRVRIGDRVEIGAHTCVDRAFLEETVIGDDSKLDNLVQVGHNSRLGRAVLIAAQAGLAGGVGVEDGVMMGGQAGVAERARLGRGLRVGAQSGLHGDYAPGQVVMGTPARPAGKARRIWAALGELPELLRRVAALEKAR
jgi:UDP-3-O-[3-hydroxymyristoyl] glucosamine N-acyltransferase